MLVTIDGIVALCPNLNCNYNYNVSAGIVMSQTLSSTGVLTITGVLLPTTSDVYITFGPTICNII